MGDVTTTAHVKFANNMRLELNQHESKLYPTVRKQTCTASEKEKIDNIISSAKTRKKNQRNGIAEIDGTEYDQVWVVKPEDDYLKTMVDTDDKLMTGVDLQGAEVMRHAGAINRARDDAFLGAIYGDIISGKTGTTLTAVPSSQVIPVTLGSSGGATPTGMNTEKLRRVRRVLAEGFVNLDQAIYIGLCAQQIEEISAEIEFTSSDFAKLGGRLSADGKRVMGMMGFEFVEIELDNPLYDNSDLTVDGSGYRKNPFWTADGVVMAEWENLFTRVGEDEERHFNYYCYSRTIVTGTRTDGKRTGWILNAE